MQRACELHNEIYVTWKLTLVIYGRHRVKDPPRQTEISILSMVQIVYINRVFTVEDARVQFPLLCM